MLLAKGGSGPIGVGDLVRVTVRDSIGRTLPPRDTLAIDWGDGWFTAAPPDEAAMTHAYVAAAPRLGVEGDPVRGVGRLVPSAYLGVAPAKVASGGTIPDCVFDDFHLRLTPRGASDDA